MIEYVAWFDRTTGTWEVVRCENGKALIVQRNIQTKAKAISARDIWRERQRMQDASADVKTA